MTDQQTKLTDLKQLVAHFVQERRWEKFHQPKNLSMSISIEASELMENFQWLETEESVLLAKDSNEGKNIREELADIAIYILSFCNLFDIDLSTEISSKLKKNADKYPVASSASELGKPAQRD